MMTVYLAMSHLPEEQIFLVQSLRNPWVANNPILPVINLHECRGPLLNNLELWAKFSALKKEKNQFQGTIDTASPH